MIEVFDLMVYVSVAIQYFCCRFSCQRLAILCIVISKFIYRIEIERVIWHCLTWTNQTKGQSWWIIEYGRKMRCRFQIHFCLLLRFIDLMFVVQTSRKSRLCVHLKITMTHFRDRNIGGEYRKYTSKIFKATITVILALHVSTSNQSLWAAQISIQHKNMVVIYKSDWKTSHEFGTELKAILCSLKIGFACACQAFDLVDYVDKAVRLFHWHAINDWLRTQTKPNQTKHKHKHNLNSSSWLRPVLNYKIVNYSLVMAVNCPLKWQPLDLLN